MDWRKRILILTASTTILASMVLVVAVAAGGCQRRDARRPNAEATGPRQAVSPARPPVDAPLASHRRNGTAESSRGTADTRRAADAANRESRRKYRVEPFLPHDFRRTSDEAQIVFIAMVGMGYGDIEAKVCFSGDKPPEVMLTLLTSGITAPAIGSWER
jgi:hypothetical protein